VLDALAQRLHDHAIDDALGSHLADRPEVIAVMGGHSMRRTDDAYAVVAALIGSADTAAEAMEFLRANPPVPV